MKSNVNDLIFQSIWVQSRAVPETSLAQIASIASGAQTGVESDNECETHERGRRTGEPDDRPGEAVGQFAEESAKVKGTR